MVGGCIHAVPGQGRGVFRWTCTCKQYSRIGTCWMVLLARHHIDEEPDVMSGLLRTVKGIVKSTKSPTNNVSFPRGPGPDTVDLKNKNRVS